MIDDLSPTNVQQVLPTAWLGRTYLYLPETSSTNDLLREQASAQDSSPPAGTVLLTDFQQSGRGRLDRRWQAPRGSSLLFSVLLLPRWPPEQFAWLTMIAGLAVTEAVTEQVGLAARIKWPNDGVLHVEGRWRKYCGILVESALAASGETESAVVGIGVNVNIQPAELPETSFPATSLLIAKGELVSRLDLLAAMLGRLEHHYERAQKGHSPQQAWQERLIYMHECVVVRSGDGRTQSTGLLTGTDAQGRLLLEDDQGQVRAIAAGDLSLREDSSPR